MYFNKSNSLVCMMFLGLLASCATPPPTEKNTETKVGEPFNLRVKKEAEIDRKLVALKFGQTQINTEKNLIFLVTATYDVRYSGKRMYDQKVKFMKQHDAAPLMCGAGVMALMFGSTKALKQCVGTPEEVTETNTYIGSDTVTATERVEAPYSGTLTLSGTSMRDIKLNIVRASTDIAYSRLTGSGPIKLSVRDEKTGVYAEKMLNLKTAENAWRNLLYQNSLVDKNASLVNEDREDCIRGCREYYKKCEDSAREERRDDRAFKEKMDDRNIDRYGKRSGLIVGSLNQYLQSCRDDNACYKSCPTPDEKRKAAPIADS